MTREDNPNRSSVIPFCRNRFNFQNLHYFIFLLSKNVLVVTYHQHETSEPVYMWKHSYKLKFNINHHYLTIFKLIKQISLL